MRSLARGNMSATRGLTVQDACFGGCHMLHGRGEADLLGRETAVGVWDGQGRWQVSSAANSPWAAVRPPPSIWGTRLNKITQEAQPHEPAPRLRLLRQRHCAGHYENAQRGSAAANKAHVGNDLCAAK